MTDVDEERLGALFQAAANDSGAPPPAFDHDTVVLASRRATVRRRTVVTGVGLALFAVVGIGGAVMWPQWSGGGEGGTTVAAPMIAPAPGDARARPDAGSPAQPRAERQAPPPVAEGAPEAAQAPDASVPPPPLGPGTSACADQQDPALRALVEQVLPEVVGATEAPTTLECRPAGERGVHLVVRDGVATGVLSVQYLPPGAQPEPVEGVQVAPTTSGGTVRVSSLADDRTAPAPFADRLDALVTHLSPRL